MPSNKIAISAGAFLVIAAGAGIWTMTRSHSILTAPVDEHIATQVPKDRIDVLQIEPKMTFGELMKANEVSSADATAIYAVSKDIYDLANIRAGKHIDLVRDSASGELKGLVYAVSTDVELRVDHANGDWEAHQVTIDYEVRIKKAGGTVTSSLYAAGLAADLDERVVIALAEVFQWTIDFSQDVRVGDSFEFMYEELWRDGKYVMPGPVLAAEYVNDGEVHKAYLYKDAKGEENHYDENGGSLRKMFLKAPVAFKYITSGYTTGMRYVSAFNTSTGHRAIDYAAALGTPIRATADGVVAFAGWDGPYGNKITIRHNGTYSTNYCHQSKFAVKKGQHVSQGQIIGYVGTTGFSTGPHLHYEMVKNGVKINPLRETFPSTDPVPADELEAYKKVAADLDTKLKTL